MGTIATAADGNWSAGATWIGGVPPGDGDEADANHNVAVDVAITVGARTASTSYAAITIATGKTLTFNPSLSHTIKGGIHHEGTAQVVVNSTTGTGVVIEFDCAAAYEWRTSNGHNNAGKIDLNGGASSRITIRSKSGGSNLWINDGTGPWLQCGLVEAEYVDFLRIGDSTNPFIRTSPTASTTFFLKNCVADTCGALDGTYNIGADCTYQLHNFTMKNTAHSSKSIRINNTNTLTSGAREIFETVFDKFAELYQPRGFKIRRTFFNKAFGVTDGQWDTIANQGFYNNFVRITSGSETCILAHDTKDNFIFYDNPTDYNPHYWEVLNFNRNVTVDGDIFDCNCDVSSPAQEGDCILLDDTASSTCTVTIKNVIIVKAPSNRTVGTLFSALGNANSNVDAEHCTVHTGSQGAAVGETYAGHSGMASVKSCIFWDETGAQGYKVYDSGGNESVTDLAPAADLNYNCGFNLATGSNLKGYNNLEFSSGSPGANDIVADPQFKNKNADLSTWDASLSGAGTDTNAITELKKINESGYNSAYNIPALIAYIRDAFTPQNISLKNAAHDGGDIGAVAVSAASGGRAGKYRSMMGFG